MATHSSILAWRIPMDRGTWWTVVHEVAKSQTGRSTAQHITFKQEGIMLSHSLELWLQHPNQQVVPDSHVTCG